MNRIRVVLADDHAIMREGTRRLLEVEADIQVVAESADGEETVRLVQALRPDVVLLDISMPQLNGIEVAQVVRRSVPRTRIVILTGYDSAPYARALARLGVDGYLSKAATAQEVMGAIRAVARGQGYFQASMAKLLDQEPEPLNSEEPTPREREVLRLVAEGCRNREIAHRLGTTERTVQFHLGNLFGKLNATSRTELLYRARNEGWLH